MLIFLEVNNYKKMHLKVTYHAHDMSWKMVVSVIQILMGKLTHSYSYLSTLATKDIFKINYFCMSGAPIDNLEGGHHCTLINFYETLVKLVSGALLN